MKVLTCTLYKEHCGLYTEIHGSIVVNGCQVGPAKAGKRTGVTNIDQIRFTLSGGTYSIDDFNAKIKVAILQQRQDWEPSQIKNLRLVIPKEYLFLADNTIFYALGIQDNYLEKTMLIRSTLPTGSNKTSLDTSPPPSILSLHCIQMS